MSELMCSDCGKVFDETRFVLDYQCQNCYAETMAIEITHLVYETSKATKIDLYRLLHESGLFRAIASFREIAKGGEWT